MEKAVYQRRVKKLQKRIEESGLDGFVSLDLKTVRYLTGYTGTSAVVAVFKSKAFFITDFRYKTQAKQEVSSMRRVIATSLLNEAATKIKLAGAKRIGYEDKRLNVAQFNQLKLGAACRWKAAPMVDELRLIKDGYETRLLAKNFSMLEKVFRFLPEIFCPGRRERDSATELESRLKHIGGEGPAFDFIVASGVRSALPHGVASEKKMRKNDIVTLDWGWVLNGYHSDNTRTFFLGKPKPKLKTIYEIVLEANQRAIDKVVPGVPLEEIDSAARDYIKKQGFSKYFGHGTGHGVGLEIHEKPTVNPHSKEIAREGMVFSIEPGIYLPDIGGVRIEDVVLVTARGCRVLTRKIPKELSIWPFTK